MLESMLIGACAGVVLFFVLRYLLADFFRSPGESDAPSAPTEGARPELLSPLVREGIEHVESEVARKVDEVVRLSRDPLEETTVLPAQGDRSDAA
jgi:hypothetical protein